MAAQPLVNPAVAEPTVGRRPGQQEDRSAHSSAEPWEGASVPVQASGRVLAWVAVEAAQPRALELRARAQEPERAEEVVEGLRGRGSAAEAVRRSQGLAEPEQVEPKDRPRSVKVHPRSSVRFLPVSLADWPARPRAGRDRPEWPCLGRRRETADRPSLERRLVKVAPMRLALTPKLEQAGRRPPAMGSRPGTHTELEQEQEGGCRRRSAPGRLKVLVRAAGAEVESERQARVLRGRDREKRRRRRWGQRHPHREPGRTGARHDRPGW